MSPIGFGFGGRRSGFQFSAGAVLPPTPIPQLIIGSTDPGQDVDDASHLALAIVAHKRGEVNLLAVAVCPQNDRAGGVARLMLDYAGLYGIPVATRKANDVAQSDYMNVPLTTDYGYTAGRSTYPDPVPVMRAALAGAPDGSVVFSCVGPLPDMQDLLQSPGDGIDPRTGMALVTAKCRDIGMVCQGGQYTPGQATTTTTDDFNWNFRPDSADYILRNFPAKIVLASASLTGPILIGPLLAPLNGDTSAQISKPVANGSGNYTVDLSNPLRAAHQEYQNLQYGSITVDTADPKRIKRSAFDPCALSYALGLGGAWTLVQGNEVMDLTAPTQGTATFTVGAGTHYNMVAATDTATIAARLNTYLDAYDLGLTMPVAPTNVVLSEAVQGVVTVSCDRQFGTTLVYSADGGAYAPVPASGITGLSAGQLHSLTFKAVRYGNSALTGPASAAVTITTKAPPAFADPSSIGLVGMWTDGTATATPSGGNVRLTALANKISGKPGFTTDYGPAMVPSTIFPSSLPTIQFQNGDAGSGPGTYGRMHTDVSAYAGATTYSVAAVVSSQQARNSSGGRIMVLAPVNANDYDGNGAWWLQTDTSGSVFQLVTKAADGSYPSVSATVGQNTPVDVRIDVAVPNGATTPNATLIINGVAIGSVPLPAGIPASAAIGFARQINQDSDSWFGELAIATAAFGARTAQQDDQLAGYRSWYAVKNGSLLPSSSAYTTKSPS